MRTKKSPGQSAGGFPWEVDKMVYQTPKISGIIVGAPPGESKPIKLYMTCKHCGEEILSGQGMIPVYFEGCIHEKCKSEYLEASEPQKHNSIEGRLGDYYY